MRNERAFDFGRAQAMAGDVHHVVDPAKQPVVAILVALAAVPREVATWEAAPVRGFEALRIAIDAAQHRGPRFSQDEVAAGSERHGFAAVVDHIRVHAR